MFLTDPSSHLARRGSLLKSSADATAQVGTCLRAARPPASPITRRRWGVRTPARDRWESCLFALTWSIILEGFLQTALQPLFGKSLVPREQGEAIFQSPQMQPTSPTYGCPCVASFLLWGSPAQSPQANAVIGQHPASQHQDSSVRCPPSIRRPSAPPSGLQQGDLVFRD